MTQLKTYQTKHGIDLTKAVDLSDILCEFSVMKVDGIVKSVELQAMRLNGLWFGRARAIDKFGQMAVEEAERQALAKELAK